MFLASNIVIGITVFFPVLALSTYILSVTSNHVEPFLPYLSGTGNYPVESCIFTSGLNVISATYILTVFLRYDC